MPRRQRRPAFRPPRGQRSDRRQADQASIDAAARRLLGNNDERSLRSLVGDLRMLLDEADRAANEQPSPEALARFRRAQRDLAEAERALNLAEDAP